MADEDERMDAASVEEEDADDRRGVGGKRPVKRVATQFLGRLANPPPEGLAPSTIEAYLREVELQLQLVKVLVDTRSAVEDAVKVQEKIHTRIKELAQLGDMSLASWDKFGSEDQKKTWNETAVPPKPEAEAEPQQKSFRWSPEEIALFNQALKEVDCNKRGAAKEIQKYVKTKHYIQIRDRLRRLRAIEQKKQSDETSGAE